MIEQGTVIFVGGAWDGRRAIVAYPFPGVIRIPGAIMEWCETGGHTQVFNGRFIWADKDEHYRLAGVR